MNTSEVEMVKTTQLVKDKLAARNLVALLLVGCTVLATVPVLAFTVMFAHEGGHGLVVVPAIILNGEIPAVPTENMQENPFRNFPLGILSLFLAFPLGVAVNGVLLYLSYKNARLYLDQGSKKNLVLLAVFTSFCILNLGGILTNLFGSDFSFIVKDALNLPVGDQWFRLVLRGVTYLVFPAILVVKKGFESDKVVVITVTTYLANTATVELIVPPLAPVFMANFWLLFILGVPVMAATTGMLAWNRKLAEKRSEKGASSAAPSQSATVHVSLDR